MKDSERNKLYTITAVLDSGLIYLCTKKNLHPIDKYWCYLTFFSHGLFYHALYKKNRFLLDQLHYWVFLLPVLSTFTKTIYPKIMSLFLIIVIQYLWIIEDKCILNEDNQTTGFGGLTGIGTITLNTILSFQIGKLI
jgi:hypothetical protein